MKYTVKKAKWQVLNGTSLKGSINCDYATLVEVFGKEHSDGDGYKTDAEWGLIINGVVCTIYNYKDGKNYCGASGLAKEDLYDWHIGGTSALAERMVEGAIAQHYAKTNA